MYCFSTLTQFADLREVVRARLQLPSEADSELLFVAVNEAVNNALIHGNQEDYNKKVHLAIQRFPREIRVTVRDEGEGMPADAENLRDNPLGDHGRGMQIIRSCVDNCWFDPYSRELIMVKQRNELTASCNVTAS
ncbi:MAG TPA: ATP-binding protein [Patescibacteria group bacterium]|nr:ATP-binding protein [Patescibacteria group bacterium]